VNYYTKEAADLLRAVADWLRNGRGDHVEVTLAARAYLASLEKSAEECVPECKTDIALDLAHLCTEINHSGWEHRQDWSNRVMAGSNEVARLKAMLVDARQERDCYMRSLKESVPEPMVSVAKVREVLSRYSIYHGKEMREEIEALLPKPRSADDALAELEGALGCFEVCKGHGVQMDGENVLRWLALVREARSK
jgi:hypothetical protein